MTYTNHPGFQPDPPRNSAPTETEQQKAGLFRAGKVAIWIWIALGAAGVAAILLCCGICGFAGLLGGATPGVTPTP